jgi:hypothetical protein
MLGGEGALVFTVSVGRTSTFGWIFAACAILTLGISASVSHVAYSWWSDPISLIGVLTFILIFLALVAAALRKQEPEERPQTQRAGSNPARIEVSVEPFVGALKSADWEVRREVVSVLGNTGSENAVDPLIGVLLHDENAKVREAAASWLGRIGGEKAVSPLVKVVKDYLAGTENATSVVFASATALGEIGSMGGLAILRRLAESLEHNGATKDLSKVARAMKDIELTSDFTNKKCIVCNLPLGRTGELVQCPFCKHMAHRDHMLEWLSRRECCPTCIKPIKEAQLITVKRRLRSPRLRAASETKSQ